jgi:hypothetical protein
MKPVHMKGAAATARFATLILAGLLAGASALAAPKAEFTTETDAKKSQDGKFLVCTYALINGEDGGFERLDRKCADDAEWAQFTLEQLASEGQPEDKGRGTVTQLDGDRRVVWLRVMPGFDRFKDGFITVTFLKNGITGDTDWVQIHVYKVGEGWVVKLLDRKNEGLETEVSRICAKRKQKFGKTVGIEKMHAPGPEGACKF